MRNPNFIKLTQMNGRECWINMDTVREIKPGGCYPGQDQMTALVFDIRPVVGYDHTEDNIDVVSFVKEAPDHVVALANGKEVP